MRLFPLWTGDINDDGFRAKHGIPEPDKDAEEKALRELKDNIGKAIVAEAKRVEQLFGNETQGAGALQAAMVAAIDAAAEGLAAYNGQRSAGALLRAVATKVEDPAFLRALDRATPQTP